MGFPKIGYQTFKLLAYQRLHEVARGWRERYPGVDIVLIEPDTDDELMFQTNILDYRSRLEVARHGFQSVTVKLAADYENLREVVARHGIKISATRVRKVVRHFEAEKGEKSPRLAPHPRADHRRAAAPVGRGRVERVANFRAGRLRGGMRSLLDPHAAAPARRSRAGGHVRAPHAVGRVAGPRRLVAARRRARRLRRGRAAAGGLSRRSSGRGRRSRPATRAEWTYAAAGRTRRSPTLGRSSARSPASAAATGTRCSGRSWTGAGATWRTTCRRWTGRGARVAATGLDADAPRGALQCGGPHVCVAAGTARLQLRAVARRAARRSRAARCRPSRASWSRTHGALRGTAALSFAAADRGGGVYRAFAEVDGVPGPAVPIGDDRCRDVIDGRRSVPVRLPAAVPARRPAPTVARRHDAR